MQPQGDIANPLGSPLETSWPNTIALLPVPILFLLIVALWAADLKISFESPYLLMSLNLIFITLVSAYAAFIAAGNFVGSSRPWLLLLSSGALFWAASGLAAVSATVSAVNGIVLEPNTLVTVHNICAWAASSCFIVEMKAVSVRDDLSKLDIDAILQSAKDLHESVTELRKAKEDADKLNDELYD